MEPKEISKIIKKLERIENSEEGTNVEDILKLLKVGDKSLIQPLKELSNKFEWKPINNESFVPLATWVDIVCVYFDCGLSGLQEILNKKDKLFGLALGVLEEIQTIESLEVLANIACKLNFDANNNKEIEFIRHYSYSLNSILLGIQSKTIDDELYEKLNETLKNIAAYSEKIKNDTIKANAIACMGRLGRIEDIDFLKKLIPLEFPYKGLEKKMINNIKKNYS